MSYREVHTQLSAVVKGAVTWGEDGADYCEDFGATVSRRPQIVVRVTCEEDIRHTLKIASAAGKTVCVRGAGHSCNAQSITDDILLINYQEGVDDQIEILEGNRVSVPTRYRWYILEKKLNERGLMFPVLTDNLNTTIGGTLAVGGGFGIRSAFYGAQIDLVERLKLVLPNGESLWCSPTENAELFAFSLAGQSALGVIETVVLKVVPWENPIVYRRCDYASIHDLDQTIVDMLSLIEDPQTRYVRLPGFPTNRGPIPNVPLWLEYGQPPTEDNKTRTAPSLPISANRTHTGPAVMSDFTFVAHDQDKQYVDMFASFSKLWVDYFFPVEAYTKFLPHFNEILAEEHLAIIYVMTPKRPADAPRLPLHPVKETGKQYVSIGADFIIPKHEMEYVAHARQLLNGLLEKCIELGGRPYLYGSVDVSPEQKRQLFGADYDRLLELKSQYDPNGVIVSSPLIADTYNRQSHLTHGTDSPLTGPKFADKNPTSSLPHDLAAQTRKQTND